MPRRHGNAAYGSLQHRLNKWRVSTQPTNLREAEDAYRCAETNEEHLKAGEALLTLCASAADGKVAYKITKDVEEIRLAALERWNALALEEARNANNLEQAEAVHRNSEESSEARSLAFKKHLKYCRTLTTAKKLWNEVCADVGETTEMSPSPLKDQLLLKTLARRFEVEDKLIRLCRKAQDVKDILDNLHSDKLEQANQRLLELSLAEVEKATTIEQLEKVCRVAPERSTAVELASSKIDELLTPQIEAADSGLMVKKCWYF